MIKQRSTGRTQYVFDDDFLDNITDCVFDAQSSDSPGIVIGAAEGRGTTYFLDLHGKQVALRHYKRGGLIGRLIDDMFWFNSWSGCRSLKEFQLLKFMHANGLNVPQPVAARAVRRGLIYRCDIITLRVENAKDLTTHLVAGPICTEIYYQIGQEVARMHSLGVNHTDLNISNILIDSTNDIWLIDFDKCELSNGHRYKKHNLERLKRSFEKEVVRRSIHWSEDAWEQLVDGYHSHK